MICPKCGKEYDRLLALSREDNKTMICDSCGIKEAVDSVPRRPQDRVRATVRATGNKWAIENFNDTHN